MPSDGTREAPHPRTVVSVSVAFCSPRSSLSHQTPATDIRSVRPVSSGLHGGEEGGVADTLIPASPPATRPRWSGVHPALPPCLAGSAGAAAALDEETKAKDGRGTGVGGAAGRAWRRRSARRGSSMRRSAGAPTRHTAGDECDGFACSTTSAIPPALADRAPGAIADRRLHAHHGTATGHLYSDDRGSTCDARVPSIPAPAPSPNRSDAAAGETLNFPFTSATETLPEAIARVLTRSRHRLRPDWCYLGGLRPLRRDRSRPGAARALLDIPSTARVRPPVAPGLLEGRLRPAGAGRSPGGPRRLGGRRSPARPQGRRAGPAIGTPS